MSDNKKPNSLFDTVQNNPLFTMEESEDEPERGQQQSSQLLRKEKKPRKKRAVKKVRLDSNVVIKTKNKLLKQVDVTGTIGADKLRMEVIERPDENRSTNMILTKPEGYKVFTGFFDKQKPKETSVGDILGQISGRMDNPDEFDEIKLNIQPSRRKKMDEQIIENTKQLKEQLIKGEAYKNEDKRKREKIPPLMRDRSDLVKMYNSKLRDRQSKMLAEEGQLANRFKKKTYEDMMKEHEQRNKMKQEEEEKLDESFKPEDEEEIQDDKGHPSQISGKLSLPCPLSHC